MDQTRARELQEKLALEAAAMLSLAGSGAETAPYEQGSQPNRESMATDCGGNLRTACSH